MSIMATQVQATLEIERLQDEQTTLTLELSPREAFTVAAMIRLAVVNNPAEFIDAKTEAFSAAIADQIVSFFRRNGADCAADVLAVGEDPDTDLESVQ